MREPDRPYFFLKPSQKANQTVSNTSITEQFISTASMSDIQEVQNWLHYMTDINQAENEGRTALYKAC